jgi:arylsulfatase A-like enzyme
MISPFSNRFLRFLLGLLTGFAAAEPAEATARKPNIVILLADDLGFGDVGFQGGREIPTPHLDALAAGGVRCTNGYVSASICSPSRAGLMTGRYQQRFGHEFNLGGISNYAPGLPTSERTLADRLKGLGYATGLVGKWHLGDQPDYVPQRRGFDEFFGFYPASHTYFAGKEGAGIYRGAAKVVEPEYLTDAFAREAVDFIGRHRQEPFFLYVAFNAVHDPPEATPPKLKQFEAIADPRRRSYAALLSSMDDAIGRILGQLRAQGLESDTLVFFLNDNGAPTLPTIPNNAGRNAPLRGSKRTTLEGGNRVPFVVSWKGRLPGGAVYDPPVIQLDIFPTAVAAAEPASPGDAVGTVKERAPLDGVNLLPYLTGEVKTAPHDVLYWRIGPQMAIRRGDWKLVRYTPAADPGFTEAKIAGSALTPPRLYNLADDIGESRDVAGEHPQLVRELQAQWDQWNSQLKPLR